MSTSVEPFEIKSDVTLPIPGPNINPERPPPDAIYIPSISGHSPKTTPQSLVTGSMFYNF